MSAVCDGSEDASAGPNVGEHVRVVKNRDGGLGIKQNPRRVDCGNTVLCEHEPMVEEGGSRRSPGTCAVLGGAIASVVSCAVAPKAGNAVVQDAICACDGCSSLGKCHGSAALDGSNG